MSRSSRILFVEDDEAVRNALALELRAGGYLVQAQADGSSLAEIVESFRPDIAILDVMLPGRSGIELARELRNKSDLPILFLTAKDAVSSRLAGFSAGGRRLCDKAGGGRGVVGTPANSAQAQRSPRGGSCSRSERSEESRVG